MPDDPQNPGSLGDDPTLTGEKDSPDQEQQSLGDQATAGDALSSISDMELDDQAAISSLPKIDLASRYEMEGQLGKGGMGKVQLAIDRQLKRKVAIKRILASSQSALDRFVTEAQSIAALNHFNIVQIHDFGRDAEGPLLVMEHVSGGSLLDRLKDGKLDVEDAVSITCQLCDALAVAHEQGIIHRDIKPANILLTPRGDPKLTDFGLAIQTEADDRKTKSGIGMGTVYYMAPEQRRDAATADARSDLWSLAATLYQTLTGKTPDVIRLDQLPANLAPVIGKMLEENPAERYQSADEFKTELRKGMAAAIAPVVLTTGVCPGCNVANETDRNFCRGCAAPLRVECLGCADEIPVWDNICGKCGANQGERRSQVRQQLSAVIEESLTLARKHEYDNALVQLATVQQDQHLFTEDLRDQANGQVEVVTFQRDEQHQLRDQLVERADQYYQAHDYTSAVRVLEGIPDPLRSGNPIRVQLLNALAARDEVASLLQEINSDAKNKQFDGLLEKTTRFLELNPQHSQVQKLHERLLTRQRRQDQQLANDRLRHQEAQKVSDEAEQRERTQEGSRMILAVSIVAAIGVALLLVGLGIQSFNKPAEDAKNLELDPNLAKAIADGRKALNRGDWPNAILHYTEAIRIDPDYADAYYNRYNRGLAYGELGEYDKAIADYTAAIRIDPDDAEAYNNRGVAYYRLGQYDKAIVDFTDAIRIKPDYAGAYVNRGIAHRKLGNDVKADVDFAEAKWYRSRMVK